MAKRIVIGDDARQAILRGVTQLAGAVSATLGPKGHVAAIERAIGDPLITKDGVTVANSIRLPDAIENMGAQMVRQVASQTSDVAGDGTTTATILAQAIFKEGLRNLTAGARGIGIKTGIDRAIETVVAHLKKILQPVEGDMIAQIGAISANGDAQIGNLLAEAMKKVGKDGVITVENSRTTETTLEVVEGLQFDRGFISPHFVTNGDRMECVLEGVRILIFEGKLSSIKPIEKLLNAVAGTGKPILIIAEDVEGEALATLVVNKIRGTLACAAVKAPGFGDRRKAMLEDIAAMTGGKAITNDLGIALKDVKLEDLGTAKKVLIDHASTTIIEGAGTAEAVAERTEQLRAQIANTTDAYQRAKMQERLARITGGIAVVRCGGMTEIEQKEKSDRIEDAIHATQAAVEEGIVPGGGTALIRCIPALNKLKLHGDEAIGVNIVKRALEEPLLQIAKNAGLDGTVILARVARSKNPNFGFNAKTEQFGDMVQMGVIDPAKVTRLALQNAGSVAGLALMTDVLISEIREPVVSGAPSE